VVPVTGRRNPLVGAHLGITPQEVTSILTEVKKRAESKGVREERDEKRCKLQVCPSAFYFLPARRVKNLLINGQSRLIHVSAKNKSTIGLSKNLHQLLS
jgi:hypothetical protein